MITESDRIAKTLGSAALLWPELANDRGALLRKVLETGMEQVERQAEAKAQSREVAIAKSAGSLTGIWPSNWREELRAEWPA
jgi:hypothetical protein